MNLDRKFLSSGRYGDSFKEMLKSASKQHSGHIPAGKNSLNDLAKLCWL